MKIGILTYHAVSNFGAQLQALSTVSYLSKNGYVPIIINWYPEDLEKLYENIAHEEQLKTHADFVKNYLPVTKLCRTESEVISTIIEENIEALIVGSDAVLNYQTFFSTFSIGMKGIKIKKRFSNTSYPNPFWGNFVEKLSKNIPRIMMSVSAQDVTYQQITGKVKKEMEQSLLRFDYISVRDSWTQNMVKYLTKGFIIPEITPDPVFAFSHNANELILTKKDILKKFNLPENYILLSFYKGLPGVSTEWLNKFEALAKKAEYASVALCFPGGIGFNHHLKYKIDTPLSPLDWYALIKYSQGYIGHKMHPIVISIHNGTPFYSFDNYGIVKYKYFVNSKSSKIFHILKESDLLKNRCIATGRLSYKEPSPEIVLNSILHFEKNKCIKFSEKYLSKYLVMMKAIEDTLNNNTNICI